MAPALRTAWAAIALAALGPVLQGCALVRAQADQARADQLAEVTGRVETTKDSEHPLIVGLFRAGERKQLATYYLRYRSGPFHFLVPPGSYHVFAYEDRNGSMRYEDGEPGYYVGDREPPLVLAP